MIHNTPEFLITHTQKTFEKCVDVMKKKNADYSNSDINAFRNFQVVEQLGIMDVKKGMLVRMSDKFTRITTLLSNDGDAKVKEESVRDTIEDFINYLAILHAYLEAESLARVHKHKVIDTPLHDSTDSDNDQHAQALRNKLYK